MNDDTSPVQFSSVDSPARRRLHVPRIVKLLVIVDVVALVVGVCIWLAVRDDTSKENAVNPGLRGSAPPAGQSMPDLSDVAGIEPPMPRPAALAGRPVVLFATCVECRSGDIMGGFLARSTAGKEAFPGARVHVLVWGGGIDDLGIDASASEPPFSDFRFHVASTPAAIERVRRTLGIGPVDGTEESGIAFVYDTRGTWRSSFFLGQLDRDDIRHDVRALA